MILAVSLFLLYSTSAWCMLRTVRRPRLEPLAWALLLISLVGHSDALVHTLDHHGTIYIGLLEALSLLGWTLAALAGVICIDRQKRILGAILIGCAALGASFTGEGHTFAEMTEPGWELSAHILLSMAAAGLLFAAAVTAVLIVFLDRRLRARRLSAIPTELPPLDVLERLMFRLIGAGFALLTLALFTGFVFVTDLFQQLLVQKTVLSLVAWALFGVLLIGRLRFGWRGRAAVRWTLSGFGVLVIAYFGSKFVLEYVQGRHWG